MARRIDTDGTETTVTPENGRSFSLKEMQDVVGGFIEFVYFPDGLIMCCNEEGKIDGLPMNPKASAMFNRAFGVGIDVIVGNVLILTQQEAGD